MEFPEIHSNLISIHIFVGSLNGLMSSMQEVQFGKNQAYRLTFYILIMR